MSSSPSNPAPPPEHDGTGAPSSESPARAGSTPASEHESIAVNDDFEVLSDESLLSADDLDESPMTPRAAVESAMAAAVTAPAPLTEIREPRQSGRDFGPPSRPAIVDALPSYRRTLLSVAIVAFLYLWVFPYHAAVNNPNENVRVYMTVAIVDDHTFAINRIEQTWGYSNDKATRLGKLYSSKAPGTSYLGVPAYWLFTKITGRNSLALTPAQVAAHHKPPAERTVIVYWLRLWSTVLPALVFAWFWHRFLGRHTRFAALREAVFFSSMLGSLLFAYSEMFVSHAQNAFATMGALMALATVRSRDIEVQIGRPSWSLGLMFVAGLLGASATMFEYPAAMGTLAVALLILATGVERRVASVFLAIPLIGVAGKLFADGHKKPAAAIAALAVVAYAVTLTPRALARLVFAGAGSALPVGLLMFFHKRCFGSPFTPGYSFHENPEFHAETSRGFYGATAFSWEAAIRLWLDPAFGLISGTAVLLAALAGLGASFSWRPSTRVLWATRAALIALMGFALFRVFKVAMLLKGGDWHVAGADSVHWIGYLTLLLIVFAAVSLPKPTRADPGLAAAMLIACYGLSRLIGAMNNWRGGWQVGPRYLATLAPLVSLAALAGLDAYAQGSPTRRRTATIFAAGATVHAMIITGIPSAYFPHIPTDYVSPVFELFIPLIRANYVPHNAGDFLLHWHGNKGMVPFLVVALFAALLVLRGEERRPLPIAAHIFGGLAVTMLLLAPFAAIAHYDSRRITSYIPIVWEPRETPHPTTATPAVRPPAAGSAAELRVRARQLSQASDAQGAFEAFRHAAQLEH